MKILAFPYAYGSSSIFFNLKKELEPNHNLLAFDYPAHGSRISDSPLYSIDDLAEDALKKISGYTDEPYCMLGYSMGGTVIFEILKKMIQKKLGTPEHVFLLGSREPSRKFDKGDFEHYDLNDIKNLLRDKNGTPEEILSEDELITMLAPAVIADSIAMRDYTCVPDSSVSFNFGVTVIRGNKEKDTEKCHSEWEKYLNRKIDYITVNGNHFFLFNQGPEMIKHISKIIISEL